MELPDEDVLLVTNAVMCWLRDADTTALDSKTVSQAAKVLANLAEHAAVILHQLKTDDDTFALARNLGVLKGDYCAACLGTGIEITTDPATQDSVRLDCQRCGGSGAL